MSHQFFWDPLKAESNLKKHGVSFAEASSVFEDPLAGIFYDEDHSVGESREIIVGFSNQNRLLIASYTERNNFVRIISARRATKQERREYEEGKIK